MPKFTISSKFKPTGDQPEAIARLSKRLDEGRKHGSISLTGN